jgi:SAM-dependent methyltransferase
MRCCTACSGALRSWRPGVGVCRDCGTSCREGVSGAPERESHYAGYYDVVPALSPLTSMRIDAWVQSLVPYRRTGRILEVGCGAGHFLAGAAEAGFESWGTEISASGLARLEGRGFQVLAGALPSLALPTMSFDAVVMFEVLEHLDDPVAYLIEARRVLREGGLILLTTPNFNSLSRRVLGDRWRVVDPEHLTLFTTGGLQQALKRAGFRPLAVSSRNVDPTEIIRGLKRRPIRGGGERQVQVDALRQTVASRPSLRLAKDALNSVLRILAMGDTLEARALR